MSDLLNQASLVYIPSGYKEDTAYSVIPTDGSGDLTFTRASDGTRVNSAGLVENVPWNLVKYSEEFDNSYWQKVAQGTGSTPVVTPNTSNAPNGTMTADRFQCNLNGGTTGSDRSWIDIGFSGLPTTGDTTISIYVKSNTTQNFNVAFQLTGVTDSSAQLITVGQEWIRYVISRTRNNSTSLFRIGLIGSLAGISDNCDILIWGAQLNEGSTAKPYFPTTDRQNVPRLDYSQGSCPALLLEPQRTNLAYYSNNLSTSPNVVDYSTTTANVYISPDGTQNAMQFTETTANDRHGFYQHTTVTSQTYTASIFTKQTGRRYIAVTSNMTGTGATSYFDLQTMSVVSSGSGYTCSIQDFGDGWLRLILTFTASAGSRFIIWGGSPDGINYQYIGSTSISQTFYGYQLEAGSYPTSYIPTYGTSVTRVADSAFKTGISSLIGQSEGVVFLDFEIQTTNQDMVLMNIYDQAAATNGIYFYVTGSNQLQAYVDNPTPLVTITSGVLAQGRYKAALAYKLNDFAFYLNGSLVGVDSSGTVPTCNALRLENYANSPTYQEKTQVYQSAIFKTRLTNTELAALTTL